MLATVLTEVTDSTNATRFAYVVRGTKEEKDILISYSGPIAVLSASKPGGRPKRNNNEQTRRRGPRPEDSLGIDFDNAVASILCASRWTIQIR